MDRRIVQADWRIASPHQARQDWLAGRVAVGIGAVVVVLMLVVYGFSNPHRDHRYNHFVWQAAAWLEGQASIPYPVGGADDPRPLSLQTWYFTDVMKVVDADGSPTGRGLLPYPPLPAAVLLPFVAIFGSATDSQLIAVVIGALDVGLALWVLGYLRIGAWARLAATAFFGFGTVFWYASMEGTTWYLAHVVAVGLTFAAIGLALSRDPAAARAEGDGTWRPRTPATPVVQRLRHAIGTRLDGRQFLAGLLLGLAATARLPMVFGLPFFLFVGGGGSLARRAVAAGFGMAIPLVVLAGYNLTSTGQVFHPAYESVWEVEVGFYPTLPQYSYLQYHTDWGIEDPRYVPQNAFLGFLNPPLVLPPCTDGAASRGLFDQDCTVAIPRADAMGLLWTSPAWLLVITQLRHVRRHRLVAGAVVTSAAIALVNLMHFSQGWVQFGWRFSLDFSPFLLLVVALALDRLRRPTELVLAGLLIAMSIAVNWWGVVWGTTLGW